MRPRDRSSHVTAHLALVVLAPLVWSVPSSKAMHLAHSTGVLRCRVHLALQLAAEAADMPWLDASSTDGAHQLMPSRPNFVPCPGPPNSGVLVFVTIVLLGCVIVSLAPPVTFLFPSEHLPTLLRQSGVGPGCLSRWCEGRQAWLESTGNSSEW